MSKYNESKDIESSEHKEDEEMAQKEDLMIFQGGEDLTICHILDALGEVMGKSNYGTLDKSLRAKRSNKVSLLRFLRPMCTTRGEELDKMIHFFFVDISNIPSNKEWVVGLVRQISRAIYHDS